MNKLSILETKKIIKKKSTIIAVILLIVYIFSLLIPKIQNEQWTDADENIVHGTRAIKLQKKEVHQISGELNQKYLNDIVSKFNNSKTSNNISSDDAIMLHNSSSLRKYSSIAKLIGVTFSEGNSDIQSLFQRVFMINNNESTKFYSAWNNNMHKKLIGLGYTESEAISIYDNKFSEKNPFSFNYFQGWKVLIDSYRGILFGLLIFIAVCLSTSFTLEKESKADSIIMSSKNGKKNIATAKILAGIKFTTYAYIIIFALFSMVVFAIYGLTGWDASIQLLEMNNFHPYTFLMLYLIMLMVGYIACIVTTYISLFISSRSNSSFKGIIGSFIVIIVPYVLSAVPANPFMTLILNLFPMNLADLSNILTYEYLSLGTFMIPLPMILMIVLLVGSGVLHMIIKKRLNSKY